MQRVFGDLDALRYVDGRLEPERKAAFLAHLADDPVETERVAMWNRQNETLRAAFAGVALESIPPALRLGHIMPSRPGAAPDAHAPIALRPFVPRASTVVPAEPATATALGGPRAARRRDLRLPLSAAVLFALALLIVYVAHGLLAAPALWPDDAAPPRFAGPQAGLASRAADAYATFAIDSIRPVEFTVAQMAQLGAWTRRRLGATIEPADLSAEGWTLLGGRLVPVADGPAAFFIYEDRGGDRLSLLVAQAPPMSPAAVILTPVGLGTASMAWTAGPFTYVVTAGKSLDWLSRNGEALKEHVARVSTGG